MNRRKVPKGCYVDKNTDKVVCPRKKKASSTYFSKNVRLKTNTRRQNNISAAC